MSTYLRGPDSTPALAARARALETCEGLAVGTERAIAVANSLALLALVCLGTLPYLCGLLLRQR